MPTAVFLLPALVATLPPAPLPVVEAKDLPKAPRGPLTPHIQDLARDGSLQGAIRREARQTPSVPALELPTGEVRVKDKVPDISGWRAYAIDVPAGGQVKVQVVDGRLGWFRVVAVNEWGRDEAGMLQNRIHRGDPLATYINPGKEVRRVYFVVDTLDTGMSGEPFEVEVTRGPKAVSGSASSEGA